MKSMIKIWLLGLLSILTMYGGCSVNPVENSDSETVHNYDESECPYARDPTDTHPRVYSAIDSSPAWEEHGNRIAFFRSSASGSPRGLYIVDSVTLQISFVSSEVLDASWFPSGDSLLVTMTDLNLYIIKPDGTILSQFTDDGNNNWFSDISSSGRYVVWDNNYEDVWIHDLIENERYKVGKFEGDGALRAGAWGPNDDLIAHIRYRDYIPEGFETIYLMKRDGSVVRRVTYRPARHGIPAWSPGDGRYLAYETRGCEFLLDIFVYDLVKEKEYRVTNTGGRDPSWSPSSDRIVFVKMDGFKEPGGGNGFLHILDIESGVERQITFESVD